jgi:hypothetical protein
MTLAQFGAYVRKFSDASMWVVAVFVTIAYSGFGKPIWIDEFLHFAFGAMGTSEALTVLNRSLGAGVNWGQTPTMFILDHILLANFGANLWVLRLPSAIAGFVMIMLAVYFLRLRGIGKTPPMVGDRGICSPEQLHGLCWGRSSLHVNGFNRGGSTCFLLTGS